MDEIAASQTTSGPVRTQLEAHDLPSVPIFYSLLSNDHPSLPTFNSKCRITRFYWRSSETSLSIGEFLISWHFLPISRIYYLSQDLRREATLILTFDNQRMPGIYKDYFSTAWRY